MKQASRRVGLFGKVVDWEVVEVEKTGLSERPLASPLTNLHIYDDQWCTGSLDSENRVLNLGILATVFRRRLDGGHHVGDGGAGQVVAVVRSQGLAGKDGAIVPAQTPQVTAEGVDDTKVGGKGGELVLGVAGKLYLRALAEEEQRHVMLDVAEGAQKLLAADAADNQKDGARLHGSGANLLGCGVAVEDGRIDAWHNDEVWVQAPNLAVAGIEDFFEFGEEDAGQGAGEEGNGNRGLGENEAEVWFCALTANLAGNKSLTHR